MSDRWLDLVDRGILSEGVRLDAFTTYKLGGPARWFAQVDDEDALTLIVDALRHDPVDVLVIGRGSNLVVSDHGFPGLVIHLGGHYVKVVHESDRIEAGGATPLARLARSASERGRLGLEFLVGIPGSVGGAVCQNAGCLGNETRDVMDSARILDLVSGRLRVLDPDELEMSYRQSAIRATDLVLSARFRFREGDPREGERTLRQVTRWRRDHQPGGTLNAGSVFKNPPGDAAGRIIDELGLKGLRVGAVTVSLRHANFVVAGSGATAQDLFDLVGRVKAVVADRSGIILEPEVRFVGPFEEA